MKKIIIIIGVIILILVVWVVYSKSKQSTDPSVVSMKGLHWHPEIEIYVKGVKQEIPANIGVTGSSMVPVHTHDDAKDGIIHMEFDGKVVHKKDIMLGEFFKSWNKDMRSFGSNMKMTVNGVENTEYENYVMGDKDKIKLTFE